jgi:transposase
MVLNYNTHVKVYSLPADKMGAHGKIYWYAKALDTTGMGKVRLNIEDAAKYFDVTKATIYRWIKRCFKDQFFQYYKFNRDGTATVVIRSYKALPALLNLKKLGQVVWCNRAQLRDLKPTVTIANLQTKQMQSEYQAKAANKARVGKADEAWQDLGYEERQALEAAGDVRTRWQGSASIFRRVKKKAKQVKSELEKSKPILKDKSTVDTLGDQKPRKTRRVKIVLHVGSRFAIVSSKMVRFGASQLGLATDMNRSVRTIRRRTRSLDRRQMLHVLPISPDEAKLIQHDCDRKILIHDGTAYEVGTNVYKFGGKYETSSASIYTKRALAYCLDKGLPTER